MNRSAKAVVPSTVALAGVLAGGAASASAQCNAIIHNTTTVKLGVACYGQLNVFVLPSDPAAVPSYVVGTESVGIRYLPLGIGGPESEATSHGCFCEGWGVSATSPPFSGEANNAWGVVGLVSNSFASTTSTAVADCSTAGGELRIVHDFRPSSSPNLYEVLVTVTNTTSAPITGIVYRRNMDWDVEPTPFNEYTTIDTYPTPGGPLPANVIQTTNDGFVTSDPTVPPTLVNCSGIFVDCGPSDHGALFDFSLGTLGAGQSTTFKIYYGAAPDEGTALNALGVVGAQFYSFGQPNCAAQPSVPCPQVTDHGEPNTFIFAFGGALFAPGCTPPAPNMVAWLPFDDQPGPTALNIRNQAANGVVSGGALQNSPGKVGSAICFDLAAVTLPHYGALYLDNDVTMDAWVKVNGVLGPGWKYTIVDKRQFSGPIWRGYWLYVNGTTGALTLEFNDSGGPTQTAVGPVVPINNTWHHVAFSSRRNCGSPGTVCITFWKDGIITAPLSFPGEGGTIGTTSGLRVGDDLDPSTTSNYYAGCIDEVEVFGRALVDNEIKAIYAAGISGKCKEFCIADGRAIFYGAQTSIVVPYQVCNHTNTAQCYNLAFLPTNCSPAGVPSPTGITSSPASPICVPPNSCSTVYLTIPRPNFVAFGDVSCYTVCMTNTSSGDISCCDSSVQWQPAVIEVSWPPVDGPIVIGTAIDFGPIGVTPSGPGSLGMPLGVRVFRGGDDGNDTTDVSINMLPPGQPWPDRLTLVPGETTHEIPAVVEVVTDNPARPYRIVLEADVDGDGKPEPVASKAFVARLSAAPCEPARDVSFETHEPGTVCSEGGFIPWQGEVDVCGEVSTEQAGSGNRSLKIVGAVAGAGGLGDDTVLTVPGVESGRWVFRCMTFVPEGATGDGAIALMNTYDDVTPPDNSWYSAQVRLRAGSGLVQADFGAGITPMIRGEWVELRIEIDLGADSANYFYNGVEFVHARPWTDGVVPGFHGPARFRAIDFYGGEPSTNGITAMYIDDVSITPVCTPGGGGQTDCNANGVDDAVDIAQGTSLDCYTAGKGVGGRPDGIPDECQCIADWNLDGTVNSTDVSDFVNTFFADQAAGTASGDINCDGVSNSTDVSDFINLWFSAQSGQLPYAGCAI